MSIGDAILCVIAIVLPPFPVALKRGVCSCDFLINLLLCIVGYLPGLIHSWWITLSYSDERLAREHQERLQRDGHGRPAHVYVYTADGQVPEQYRDRAQVQSQQQGVRKDLAREERSLANHGNAHNPNYGAVESANPSNGVGSSSRNAAPSGPPPAYSAAENGSTPATDRK
ncbi:hypothetical protein PYCC9005_000523 [Savitreella phatthalungensis]